MTPYQRHRRKWNDCTRCSLHSTRRHVVLARGRLPADVLFIGEAPGTSEDQLGKPFVGPAGHLLDQIISRSLNGQYDYTISNLIACIPLTDMHAKLAQPPNKSIRACKERLAEIIGLCKPKLIVEVGKVASTWLPKLFPSEKTPRIGIVHPAAILRADISQQGLAIQTAIVRIEDAAAEIFEKNSQNGPDRG